jgi:chromosome segregation ATPase
MGLFGKKKATAVDLAALHVDLVALQGRLNESERERELLAARLAVLEPTPRRLEDLRHELDDHHRKLTDRIDRIERDGAAVAHQVDTALPERLAELAADLDALANLPSMSANGTAGALEQLRAGQAALANEQARQQIALRRDLAGLADQIRRGPPR